jgi:hypothetical protein
VFGAWNPSSLIDVSLFSATPSPVFPDALSGTVEARTRTPDTRFNGTVGASTSQTSAAVNGPLPFARSGYLLSLRRTFAGSVFHPDEDSYLGGNGTDWLATVTLPAAGGVLHLLSFGNDNEFDAAAAPADAMIPTPGRNEFEWYGRSYGADWRRSGNRGAIRLLAWRATLDASARWQVDQAAWDDLGSSHSSTGALATVQKEGYAARSVAGLRWTRLDAGYAVTGMHGLARDGSLDVVTGFAQHRGGTGTFAYDVTFALSSALRGVRASPGIRVNYMVSSSLSIGAALSRTHQYTQSLRNPESVLGTIFPADLHVIAGAGVPGASSDQVIGLFVYQPMPEIRISAEGYARRLRGLALVAVTESEPFATSPIATGSGEVRGLSLEASLYTSRLAILSSYAWQSVRHGDGAAAFSPAFAAQHRLEAGTVFHATATSSLRAGVTAILGRRATPVTGAIEWESCNLLDRGCELAGSPDVMAGKRGADSLPAYVRIDLGARRHWHVALAGADRQLGLFLTLTNVLVRRNVLRNVIDPETGERSMLGMRPASPLTIGIEGRF